MTIDATQDTAPRSVPHADQDRLSPAPYPSAPPAFVLRAVLGLRKALHALADAIVPPHVAVFDRSVGHVHTHLLGAVARHRIADLLAEGPRTAAEIAARTGTDADVVHRMLRVLATLGIFTLQPDGRFANNRLSSALRSGTLARCREWCEYTASRSNVDAWADFEGTLRTGKNGFERVHGMSVWSWFDAHPHERETFAQAMMGITVADAPVIASLYPFAEVQRICDVGGGRGTLLSELLIRNPHLSGVLCDGKGVLESARDLLQKRGVLARVELAEGNFFERVPGGCDAYLMKNILHDWDDARCKTILSTCRRAMQPGHRLLIVEVLTERNAAEGFGPFVDVQMMMVCCEGRERSREELVALLEATGFRAGRVFPSPTMSIVEGIAA